ncbi:type II toxin-antitoxin system PemK/MazF family toxin [Sphingobium algorifonticola]|uniref:Type II toxin-antitoxin system PemK/MazF family toxin n=1 Tax=Sphingobium algorifonticola TaxID=2008318 RepID=A0A437J8K0_9SPHN|nr:type II toxin-antitoxin system PemK/MazF family toxin [Sphingobium algorifonticola]RVT41795.1 type II toxin-antitoxin system PemK/MazF family toxin [Sphingobium algorifonticola]
MIFDRFDICIVDFPFSDRNITKRRPALIICDRDFIYSTGNILVAMITSAKHSQWPGDCPITDLPEAGLSHPSKVRMRFSTFATTRVVGHSGRLADENDRAFVRAALHETICA